VAEAGNFASLHARLVEVLHLDESRTVFYNSGGENNPNETRCDSSQTLPPLVKAFYLAELVKEVTIS
jgi:hypothetical protein